MKNVTNLVEREPIPKMYKVRQHFDKTTFYDICTRYFVAIRHFNRHTFPRDCRAINKSMTLNNFTIYGNIFPLLYK